MARPDLVGSNLPADPTGTRTFILRKADNDAILQLSGKVDKRKSTGIIHFRKRLALHLPAYGCHK